ncbi:MAG TPA: DUF952 domain-containing protein [Candidatus Binataceae bacterium]|nr:DUF952 domain-containing protein [Candidatus Binataceae bacterium]
MILHIATRDDWNRAQARGAYRPAGFTHDGFIHCSTLAQAVATANKFFLGQRDLLLLCIDEHKLAAPLRYEGAAPPAGSPPAEPRAGLFPHLYGELNLDAVTQALEFRCSADGSFKLPAPPGQDDVESRK